MYEQNIVDEIKSLIQQQTELVQQSTSANEVFAANLYQMEADRLQYMLASYLRGRIKKIEKYVLAILKSEQMTERLSDEEFTFAKGYADLLEKSYVNSFLQWIPQMFRDLVTQNSEVDMVEEPDLDAPVFMRVKQNVGAFEINPDGTGEKVYEIDLNEGDILAASYRPFRGLLIDDRIDLI